MDCFRSVWRSTRATLVVGALILFSACAGPPERTPEPASSSPPPGGVVDAQVVTPEASTRYAAKPGANYEQPVAFPDNIMPVYPAEALSARLAPIEVTVRLIVGTDGLVSSAQPLDPPEPSRQAFVTATLGAVSAWRFLPLVEILPEGGPSEIVVGNITSEYPGKATALPFHRDYRFTFEQIDGRPNVRHGEAPTERP